MKRHFGKNVSLPYFFAQERGGVFLMCVFFPPLRRWDLMGTEFELAKEYFLTALEFEKGEEGEGGSAKKYSKEEK